MLRTQMFRVATAVALFGLIALPEPSSADTKPTTTRKAKKMESDKDPALR